MASSERRPEVPEPPNKRRQPSGSASVSLATTRYAIPGSIRSHTNAIQAALDSVGVESQIVPLRYFGKWPVGGAILPTVRMLLRGQPAARFVHAVDIESCLRGTAVVTVHDPLIGWEQGARVKEFPYRWQMVTALHRARRVVGVSSETAERIRAVFPSVAEKVRYIPPPFDTRVGPAVPKMRDLIWIGRNDPSKGMMTFLDVLEDPRTKEVTTLVKWTPQAKWPDLADRARGRLKPLPQVQSIDHPVDYAQLQDWISGSKCIVSTSAAEGLQAVTMEAYIRRTRLVLPRIATYTDVYPARVIGVHWYEPGDRDDLIRAIQEGIAAPVGFTPDPDILDQVSYTTVGKALREAYVAAGWRGP